LEGDLAAGIGACFVVPGAWMYRYLGSSQRLERKWNEATMEPLLPDSYAQFLADLKSRIQTAQIRASLAVNRELVLLYWQIGRDILDRQRRESWGAKVIDRLAADLKRAFPEMKGFSPRNLKYMRAFAEAWPEEPFVQAVLAQIT
jgi:predicted nuclease of restriction endonuclease-like (RecB) superfamily